QSTNVDLQLDPGFTIQFAVVGPDGKPADDINVYGMRPGFPIEKLSSSTFDAVAFEPNEQRQISVWDAHRRIGKVVHVRPSDAPDHKVTIKLQPWSEVTGRLVGPDGQAVTNARIETQVDSFFPGGTDAKGRFHIRLLPGMDCSLRGIKGREEFNTDAQHVPIRPGETKDLGDVHMKSFS
ncbi:MAG TPA: carboxypeptidase-like regulatory domain-containing protein, partial [Tepidisphaeraceae bacterium]|nr:carboxypeptidase-like regulatory domain-containing protein [Tepidisphaeraceae bacterium]